ncbi:hypothetical protein B0T16DRAFT_390749 [Cercophora newfieldiana]|uniref:Uncharacterized protein n=1 Tax=Cercophora newfieldiana TaxID=92897 RepID=A0AA39Y5H0_9PEZI|nr:hypothetical protein B0T16DRAFT_390749 [Cercophora newfieldiana]
MMLESRGGTLPSKRSVPSRRIRLASLRERDNKSLGGSHAFMIDATQILSVALTVFKIDNQPHLAYGVEGRAARGETLLAYTVGPPPEPFWNYRCASICNVYVDLCAQRSKRGENPDALDLLHCRGKWNCLPATKDSKPGVVSPPQTVVHQSAGVVLQMTRGRCPERTGSQTAQLSTRQREVELSKRRILLATDFSLGAGAVNGWVIGGMISSFCGQPRGSERLDKRQQVAL